MSARPGGLEMGLTIIGVAEILGQSSELLDGCVEEIGQRIRLLEGKFLQALPQANRLPADSH